jgi:RNA polymerase sigma factor (TIGR02999 family)
VELVAMDEVTVLLQAWKQGNNKAGDALFDAVYVELRKCAARYLGRERRDHTLQPTALVHEAYLRMANQVGVDWQGRAHFVALAASMMRRILVDHARAHCAEKRGGDWERLSVDLSLAELEQAHDPADLLALDAAVEELASVDPFQARLVDLRFFGGLSIEETAQVLESSPATVKREWALARAWLYRQLEGNVA